MPLAENFGKIAAAGTHASAAAAANAHHGIVRAHSVLWFGARQRLAADTIAQSAATAATVTGENPTSANSGKVAALCTAQPMTGAAPAASGRGNRRRHSA